jgi:hypothetical protein
MAIVAVLLLDYELWANFYQRIGCRNSNMIVIHCNHCSGAIKIRRDQRNDFSRKVHLPDLSVRGVITLCNECQCPSRIKL